MNKLVLPPLKSAYLKQLNSKVTKSSIKSLWSAETLKEQADIAYSFELSLLHQELRQLMYFIQYINKAFLLNQGYDYTGHQMLQGSVDSLQNILSLYYALIYKDIKGIVKYLVAVQLTVGEYISISNSPITWAELYLSQDEVNRVKLFL